MEQYYIYFRFIHIVAIICFMAGMLYLPRLYVYHCDAKKNGEFDDNLKIMEYRLLYYIINPSLVVSLISGFFLVLITKEFSNNINIWIHIKLSFVLGMIFIYLILYIDRKKFKNGNNIKSQLYFRVINELITIFMVCIVFLVVVKPF